MATLRDIAGKDAFGFELDQTAMGNYQQYQSEYLPVLARRAARWNSSGFFKRSDFRKSSKLKRFVRKGIPHEVRHRVWMAVSGAAERQKREPNAYKTALQQAISESRNPDFSDVANSIKLDIMRTFPHNAKFRRQENILTKKAEPDLEEQIASNKTLVQLRSTLLAFAVRNRSIGYCQGMSCVAAILLLVTDGNEEDAFWLLEALIVHILPKDFYTAKMLGLRAEIELVNTLISRYFAELADLLVQYNLSLDLVMVKWFVCVFVDVLPTDTTLRVLDCLFYEGSYVLPLITLTLIDDNRNDIFVAIHNGISGFIEIFNRIVQVKRTYECHEFIERAFLLKKRLKLNRQNKRLNLESLREEARTKINDEDDRRTERRNQTLPKQPS